MGAIRFFTQGSNQYERNTMILRRRAALTLGLTSFIAGTSHAAAAPQLTALQRFIKMRGALDGRLVIGSVTGTYYGVVNGQTIPLFGLISAVFSRYQAQKNGYQVTELEQAYYTDLATGEALATWKNPYTNEMINIPAYSSPAATSLITPDLHFHATAATPPQVRVQHVVDGPDLSPAAIIFIERVAVSVPAAAGKPGFQYQDHTSLTAPRQDVDRPDTKTSGSSTSFAATCSWRPWLKMGTRPGHMSATGQGHFGVALNALPSAWQTATARRRPELLEQH